MLYYIISILATAKHKLDSNENYYFRFIIIGTCLMLSLDNYSSKYDLCNESHLHHVVVIHQNDVEIRIHAHITHFHVNVTIAATKHLCNYKQ